MTFCVKVKKIDQVKTKPTNYNYKNLETLEVAEDLKKKMDKMYNIKNERKEPIDKRWENIKNTVINAAKTTLNMVRKKPNKN